MTSWSSIAPPLPGCVGACSPQESSGVTTPMVTIRRATNRFLRDAGMSAPLMTYAYCWLLSLMSQQPRYRDWCEQRYGLGECNRGYWKRRAIDLPERNGTDSFGGEGPDLLGDQFRLRALWDPT